MSTHILTRGGFVKVYPLSSQDRENAKFKLYHLKDLTPEKVASAKAALEQKLKKNKKHRYTYESDLTKFEEEVKQKHYLLKEGTKLHLLEGGEVQHEGVPPHIVKLSQKASYLFQSTVSVGGNFIIGSNAYIANANIVIQANAAEKTNKPLSTSPIETLKSIYRQDPFIHRFLGVVPLPLEKSYINLQIVQEEEQKEKEEKLRRSPQSEAGEKEKSSLSHNTHLRTFEEIYGAKKPIEIKDLFNPQPNETHQNLLRRLVLGKAGIGKSTFCKYAAYMWAKGKLWNDLFDWVFWIPLLELNNKKDIDLIDFVYQKWFKLTTEKGSFEKFWRETISSSQRVLFLLDGYDELSSDIFLQNLLNSYTSSHVLITSRPYSTSDLKEYQRLEITGFMDKNIEQFIGHCFTSTTPTITTTTMNSFSTTQTTTTTTNSSRMTTTTAIASSTKESNLAENLLQFLHQNPAIYGIAHIPILLDLLCRYWQDQKLEGSTSSKTGSISMTTLYCNLETSLLKRCFQPKLGRKKVLSSELKHMGQPLTQFLSKIAYLAMKQEGLIIQEKLMSEAAKSWPNQAGFLQDALQMGLLKQIENKEEYYFLHLTFQEYYAATYFTNLCIDNKPEAQTLIAEIKFKPRYTLILRMIAGLLSKHIEGLQAFFKALFSDPRDLAKSAELILLARCFEECEDPTIISQYVDFINNVEEYLIDPIISLDIKFQILSLNNRLLRNEKILNVIIGNLNNKKLELYELLERLIKEGTFLPEKLLEKIFQNFLANIHTNDTVKNSAVGVLKNMVEKNTHLAKTDLCELLKFLRTFTDQDFNNFERSAIKSLQKIAKGEMSFAQRNLITIIQVLYGLQLHNSTQGLARNILKNIESSDISLAQNALEKFFEIIKTPKISFSIRHSAIEALTEIALEEPSTDQKVFEKLVCALVEGQASGEIRCVIDSLVQLTQTDATLTQQAFQKLIYMLKICPESVWTDSSNNNAIINSVVKIVQKKDFLFLIINELIQVFENKGYIYDDIATKVFSRIADGDGADLIIQKLKELIQTPKKSYALYTLREIANKKNSCEQDIIEFFIQYFEKFDTDSDTAKAIARNLEMIVKPGQTVTVKSQKILVNIVSKPSLVIWTSIYSCVLRISKSKEISEQVRQSLAHTIKTTQPGSVVWGCAVLGLGWIVKDFQIEEEKYFQEAEDALMKMIYNLSFDNDRRPDRSMRAEAVTILVKLAKVYPKAQDSLIKIIYNDPPIHEDIQGMSLGGMLTIALTGCQKALKSVLEISKAKIHHYHQRIIIKCLVENIKDANEAQRFRKKILSDGSLDENIRNEAACRLLIKGFIEEKDLFAMDTINDCIQDLKNFPDCTEKTNLLLETVEHGGHFAEKIVKGLEKTIRDPALDSRAKKRVVNILEKMITKEGPFARQAAEMLIRILQEPYNYELKKSIFFYLEDRTKRRSLYPFKENFPITISVIEGLKKVIEKDEFLTEEASKVFTQFLIDYYSQFDSIHILKELVQQNVEFASIVVMVSMQNLEDLQQHHESYLAAAKILKNIAQEVRIFAQTIIDHFTSMSTKSLHNHIFIDILQEIAQEKTVLAQIAIKGIIQILKNPNPSRGYVHVKRAFYKIIKNLNLKTYRMTNFEEYKLLIDISRLSGKAFYKNEEKMEYCVSDGREVIHFEEFNKPV